MTYEHDMHCSADRRKPKYDADMCSCYKPGGQGRNYMSLREALMIYRPIVEIRTSGTMGNAK